MQQKGYFFGRLQEVIETNDLTLIDIKVYCKVANLPHGCFANQGTIADWLNCSRRSVNRSLVKLQQICLIELIDGAYRLALGAVKPAKNVPASSDRSVTKIQDSEPENNNLQSDKPVTTKRVRQKCLSKCDKIVSVGETKMSHTTNIYNTSIRTTKDSEAKASRDDNPVSHLKQFFTKKHQAKAADVLKAASPFWQNGALQKLSEWLEYKKDKGQALAPQTLKTLLKKFDGEYTRFSAAVDYTIEMGWQGLREPNAGSQTAAQTRAERIAQQERELNELADQMIAEGR